MKRMLVALTCLVFSGVTIAQICGPISCPLPPSVIVGGPTVTFQVPCTAPGGNFTDTQSVFEAINNSTTVQANAVSIPGGGTWLTSMTVNGDASAKCLHNFRTGWEGCGHAYGTVPFYEYTVTIKGTVSCTINSNVQYKISVQ